MTFVVLGAEVTVTSAENEADKFSKETGNDGIATFEGDLPEQVRVRVEIPEMPLFKPKSLSVRVVPGSYNLQEVTFPPLAASKLID